MRTVIIDDESQIIDGLTILLKNTEVDIVGTATNFNQAVELINRENPDLVFLDVQLHNRTGFEVLSAVNHLNFKLIFITAYNDYAIKAFKYNAFDYLLKPIDPDELFLTLKRLKKSLFVDSHQINQLNDNEAFSNLVVRTTQKRHNIPTKDIVYCKSDQGYTHFYLKNGKHILSSKTLKEYVNILPEEFFMRVHQSYLVQWNYVSNYQNKGILVLSTGDEIPVSVRKRKEVLARLA